MKSSGPRALLLVLALGTVSLGTSGCGSIVANRGNEVTAEQVSAIEVGTHGRQQILSMLGSPSSTSSFGEETWYYIFERTESTAFLEQEVRDRTILTIRFDEEGAVKEAKTAGLEQAQEMSPVERETPTAGNRLSFFEQMIANIGRFNE